MDWITASNRFRAPMFEPLRGAIESLPADRWPTHADLTCAAGGLTTARGMPLRFVMPRDDVQSCPRGRRPPDRERRYYEVRIIETGEVETRPENWHDLFNALAWIAFPRAKAAINAQHAAILAERGEAEAKHRGPERDSLTLFDEGGIAVVSSDPALFDLIVDFEWKTLFWHRREELARHVRFVSDMRSSSSLSRRTSAWSRRPFSCRWQVCPMMPRYPRPWMARSRITSPRASASRRRVSWRRCRSSAFRSGTRGRKTNPSTTIARISAGRHEPQGKMRA